MNISFQKTELHYYPTFLKLRGGVGEKVECMSSSKTALASTSGMNLNDRIVAYTNSENIFFIPHLRKVLPPFKIKGERMDMKMYLIQF